MNIPNGNDNRGKEDRAGTTAMARTMAPDLQIAAEQCLLAGRLDPCTIVIFGASGDLTARKLMPALFHLFVRDALPEALAIVGCADTELTDEQFRNKMQAAVQTDGSWDGDRWREFARRIYYRSVQLDEGALDSFKKFAADLHAIDETHKTQGNRFFYLAIPPGAYAPAVFLIGHSGLAAEGPQGPIGWARIVVEKPFGRDLASAIELDQRLHRHFKEHQIFRIDHYLAKETVQNVLMLRFANAIFEPLWNRTYIDRVRITAAETLGVEHRAGYYEQAGVLRDMFQNHMMQLLSLAAMEPPALFEAERVRDEKAKVFHSLRPFPVDDLKSCLVLGQYGEGTVDWRQVPAYRRERGVNQQSLTPTFASMKLFIDNWRWQGVPFYLTSGKRLARKLTEISIAFKEVPHSMFRPLLGEHISANRLILGIYPEETITLTFQAKNPGATVHLRPVTMDFQYNQNYSGPLLEAYEKVLIDSIRGDQMLFLRQDGVELCWSFLTPILDECEACGNRQEMLQTYEAGSWGPRSAF